MTLDSVWPMRRPISANIDRLPAKAALVMVRKLGMVRRKKKKANFLENAGAGDDDVRVAATAMPGR
jgi:hypothetical protein